MLAHRLLTAFLASVLIVANLSAQQGITEVRGRVLDQQGAVLPGVTVIVTNQETGLYREVVSNTDGTYFVTGIVPGTYQIAAELSGFKKATRRDVLLSVGRTVTVDVQLEVGGLEETVTVTSQTPLIDLTSPEIGGNITKEEISGLPSANRNYIEFVGLLPGAVPISSTT
jgi:Carboxypeptidase regulatory-like domain